jgi:hypothetical protein
MDKKQDYNEDSLQDFAAWAIRSIFAMQETEDRRLLRLEEALQKILRILERLYENDQIITELLKRRE